MKASMPGGSPQISSPHRGGFTLMELLVVCAILTLLVLIRLPALAGVKSGSKRVQCSANLRQFAAAVHIYVHENDGRLPSYPPAGAFAHDVPWAVGTHVEETGADWKIMYCPGTAPRFTQADNWQLYNMARGFFRVMGYVTTFSSNPAIQAADRNTTLLPPRIVGPSGFVVEPASKRVLLADATLSGSGQNNKALADSYNFVSIQGAYIKTHLSAHLNGRIPAGGNVAVLDGHVEWRSFEDMAPRTIGAFPVFWW